MQQTPRCAALAACDCTPGSRQAVICHFVALAPPRTPCRSARGRREQATATECCNRSARINRRVQTHSGQACNTSARAAQNHAPRTHHDSGGNGTHPERRPIGGSQVPRRPTQQAAPATQSATTTTTTARPYAKSNRRFRFRVHLRREHVVLFARGDRVSRRACRY